jgi:hypothetical protein
MLGMFRLVALNTWIIGRTADVTLRKTSFSWCAYFFCA